MVPDKSKGKGRQVSLTEVPEDKPDSVDQLVSKAFDSDPKVRLKVAQDLGKLDDPRAIFALIELSSDKEPSVKEAAQRSLGSFKQDAEAIVSLEKLLAERKEVRELPTPASTNMGQRMAPTIERLFSHYEPKRRENAKRKLFPSLQKLFGFSKQELDPMQELDKIGATVSSIPLTSEIPHKEEIPKENAANFPFGQKEEPPSIPAKSDLVEVDEEDTHMVSEQEEKVAEEMTVAQEGKFYELAYRLATTPGMGKSDLKREQNRLISSFKREVEVAFKLASAKAKDEGFANFNNLKPGMKGLSFAELPISSISEIAYGPRKHPYLRISLFDGKKELAVLVPKERGQGISAADRLSLKKVDVDFLVEKNEIILLVGKKSAVVVVN
jgi:hypothetical protein